MVSWRPKEVSRRRAGLIVSTVDDSCASEAVGENVKEVV